MRLLFRSSFDRWTGYGNDAVDIAMALDRAGVEVVPWVDRLQSGLPGKFVRLLQRDMSGPFDVVLQFAPPYDVKPWELRGVKARKFGWTMWERTPMLPLDFQGHGWDGRELGWRGLDGLFVTTAMNLDALGAVDPVTPMQVVPCGVGEWPELEHGSGDRIRFGMVGMLNGRKDPFLLLDVWRELKREVPEFDGVLELKTAAPGLHPGLVDVYPDVVVHTAVWPAERLLQFYADCDVLVSVSRGEGNDKPCMEFMATGGPVIASDWSGHQNYVHEAWSWPVGGRLEADPQGWSDFRVDRGALKRALLECWADRQAVQVKGRRARGVMLGRFGWDRVVEDLLIRMSRS